MNLLDTLVYIGRQTTFKLPSTIYCKTPVALAALRTGTSNDTTDVIKDAYCLLEFVVQSATWRETY